MYKTGYNTLKVCYSILYAPITLGVTSMPSNKTVYNTLKDFYGLYMLQLPWG